MTVHWKPELPKRDLLGEAIAATSAAPSFDLGLGPKLYVFPGLPPGRELTEMQLINHAIRAGLIPPA